MASQLQKVYRFPKRTSPHDIQLSEEEIPVPGNAEVLIKVCAVALNYRDTMIATSTYPFPVKDDVVPCSDLSGEIVKVGDKVKDFAPGDRVIASFDQNTQYGPIKNWENGLGGPIDGVLRQYVALSAQALVKVPKDSPLSFAQWASLVCTGTTAWNTLYGNTKLRPGQTVLCLGTGGVSITALLIAKAAGAITIVTSSSDEKLKHVQEKYGANHIINYKKTPDWAAEVQKVTGGRGADFILENGGSGTIAQSLQAVALGGNIGVIGLLSQAPKDQMPDVTMGVLAKNAVVRGIVIGSKQQLEEVATFVAAHDVQLPVEKTFGFTRDEVVKAFEYLSSGQHIGKVCIVVD